MKRFPVIVMVCWLTISACAQKKIKHETDPKAKVFVSKAIMLLQYVDIPDSAKKAIGLLDTAISIDNKCLSCYDMKTIYHGRLKQYDQAIQSGDKIIELNPDNITPYSNNGQLYLLKGDSVSAYKYLHQSVDLSNKILDTMNTKSKFYPRIKENIVFCSI